MSVAMGGGGGGGGASTSGGGINALRAVGGVSALSETGTGTGTGRSAGGAAGAGGASVALVTGHATTVVTTIGLATT